MTEESFFLRVQWGPRNEGVEACTRRLNAFILELAYIDPAFNLWHRTTADDPGRREYLWGQEQLATWLAEGACRTDNGDRPAPRQGFSIALNADRLALPMRVNCGGYAAWVRNSCTIELARDGDASERVLRAAVLENIARAAIRVWQPDHGVVTSHECSRRLSAACPLSEAGWLTYLSRIYDPIDPMPGHVEMLENGRLVLATAERFSSLKPDHVKFVRELSDLMEPLVPEPRGLASRRCGQGEDARHGDAATGRRGDAWTLAGDKQRWGLRSS
jgi:hypothetical protein